MLKVYLKLRATKDIEKTGWKKGDVMEMINDVFINSLLQRLGILLIISQSQLRYNTSL